MRNPYEPKNIKVVEVKKLSPDAKLFRLKTKMTFVPGQFVLAGIWGYGEAPFGNSIRIVVGIVSKVFLAVL